MTKQTVSELKRVKQKILTWLRKNGLKEIKINSERVMGKEIEKKLDEELLRIQKQGFDRINIFEREDNKALLVIAKKGKKGFVISIEI
jgi:hypothetical protein